MNANRAKRNLQKKLKGLKHNHEQLAQSSKSEIQDLKNALDELMENEDNKENIDGSSIFRKELINGRWVYPWKVRATIQELRTLDVMPNRIPDV